MSDKQDHLRLLPSPDEQHAPKADELKPLLDDLNRRYLAKRERIEQTDDTPDAA